MTDVELSNKPLVEAIFELRWNLEDRGKGMLVDPHYKLLIGQIYEAIADTYPEHKQLSAANIPEDMAAYVVQHQFRSAHTGWPLVQIGPGVITLNDTEDYSWPDFHNRVSNLIGVFAGKYPHSENDISLNSVLLRYIDAEEFDFQRENPWDFLRSKLKVGIDLPEELFDGAGVVNKPLAFDLKFTFPSSRPKGAAHLRFVRGTTNKREALIWETQVQSLREDTPDKLDQLLQWVDEAHNLTHDWFFKMIEGELLEKYR